MWETCVKYVALLWALPTPDKIHTWIVTGIVSSIVRPVSNRKRVNWHSNFNKKIEVQENEEVKMEILVLLE